MDKSTLVRDILLAEDVQTQVKSYPTISIERRQEGSTGQKAVLREMARIITSFSLRKPLYYYLRDNVEMVSRGKDGRLHSTIQKIPVVTVCLLSDNENPYNISRGIAFYKIGQTVKRKVEGKIIEKPWGLDPEYGRSLALLRALWSLDRQEDGRRIKTYEMEAEQFFSGTAPVRVTKKTVVLLIWDGIVPKPSGTIPQDFIPKCWFQPTLTDREQSMVERLWERKEEEEDFPSPL